MSDQPHEFMGCRPGSCALPHPLPAPEEAGCHWPYGNVYFGGTEPYHRGDPICMLTEAQHAAAACFMCDPSILGGSRCATGYPICDAHRAELGLPVAQAAARRVVEELRIATDQLQAFSDQERERYPGEMGTFAHDALIRMSVVE